MTPADHGFKKCSRCDCWRPPSEVVVIDNTIDGARVKATVCTDDAVCSRLAEVGKGELEGAES